MQLPQMNAQSGQALTEAILLMVVFMGLTFATAQFFREEEVLKKLIKGPFTNLSGMLQNGVWAPPDVGAVNHPSVHRRHIVISGEGAR